MAKGSEFNPLELIEAPIQGAFDYAGGKAQADANKYAADKQSAAARDTAKIAADAANHGADLKDAETQRAEAFQREQADYAGQQQEVDRHANYDQYAANRRKIGSISEALGFGGVEVPDYVPGVVPHFGNAPAPAPTAPRVTPTAMINGRSVPINFGAVVNGPASPPVDPRVMGGNGGVVTPPGTPELQPDGTYAIPSSMPRYRTFGQSLGAA